MHLLRPFLTGRVCPMIGEAEKNDQEDAVDTC